MAPKTHIARQPLAAVAIQKQAQRFRLLDCFGAMPLAMTENGQDLRPLVLYSLNFSCVAAPHPKPPNVLDTKS